MSLIKNHKWILNTYNHLYKEATTLNMKLYELMIKYVFDLYTFYQEVLNRSYLFTLVMHANNLKN